jgi:hypothetical protein
MQLDRYLWGYFRYDDDDSCRQLDFDKVKCIGIDEKYLQSLMIEEGIKEIVYNSKTECSEKIIYMN